MRAVELPSTFEGFRTHILQQAIVLQEELGPDNLDLSYPAASHTLSASEFHTRQFAYAEFLSAHEAKLFDTYRMLEDAESRNIFLALIMFRLLGHRRVRLPSNNSRHQDAVSREKSLEAQSSMLDGLEGGQALKRFVFEVGGESFVLDCLAINIRFSFFLRQYFLDRGEISVSARAGDHVIDAGACFGDTAVCFSKVVGPSGLVHSFEPLGVHQQLLRHNLAQNGCNNVKVHPHGLGSVNRSGEIDEGGIDPGHTAQSTTPLRTLDDMVDQGEVERVDFIKIDIEGHEFSLLQGAKATISLFRPRMAISIYHKSQDYFEIPKYIESVFGNYRMFIENYTISDAETILYCLPSQRVGG